MDIWLQTDIAPDFGPFGHYCTEIPKSSPARGIFGVQKFLRYRRNFWISISASKFQTYFTFIIFPYMVWIWPHGAPPIDCATPSVTFQICIISGENERRELDVFVVRGGPPPYI